MKSLVTELLAVADSIITDASAKCSAHNHLRDQQTLRSRVEHEGLSFLTIQLPQLGKDLERSLSCGAIEPGCFRSFKKRLKTPAFLQGFFALVFDVRTGRILDDPNVAAIEGIRQIAYAFKKLEVECTPQRKGAAIVEFQQCELDLEKTLAQCDVDDFINVSGVLWPLTIGDGILTSPLEMKPRHGPGATGEKIMGNQKFAHKLWHERLEPYFPMLHFAFSSESAYGSPEFQDVSLVCEGDEAPVRVHLVPKTLKAPRVIAIEPVCMQYAQQAISRELVSALEKGWLTRGHVNFRDQQINRDLAIQSSLDGRLATLDLSSASDRVPYSLAIRMFDSNPDLQGAVSASRSMTAKLPNGEILPLRKFASMGSALCFPVEAMYFYTLCVMARLKKHNLPVTSHNAFLVSRDVYIYGDDIVVPADEAVTVMETMQRYYCKVNTTKSFWTGKFRESCGMDAYAGEEVTPSYIKHLPPEDRRGITNLVSWTKAANHFYKRGYWQTSSTLMKRVEAILGALPIMGPEAGGLGKVSFQHVASIERWGLRYQRPEVRAWVISPVYHHDKLEGYSALMKCLLRLISPEEGNVFQSEVSKACMESMLTDDLHLTRSVRRGAVALKRRWIQPY